MIRATKEFTFDCAHMLSGHQGLCKNLHGHTYKVQVTITRNDALDVQPELNDDKLEPAGGMVLDFKHLKEICKEIFDSFDHAFIFNENVLKMQDKDETNAERMIINDVLSNGLKYVAFPGRPTAENMAKYFYDQIQLKINQADEFGLPIQINSVRVWETPTSFAEYIPGR